MEWYVILGCILIAYWVLRSVKAFWAPKAVIVRALGTLFIMFGPAVLVMILGMRIWGQIADTPRIQFVLLFAGCAWLCGCILLFVQWGIRRLTGSGKNEDEQ